MLFSLDKRRLKKNLISSTQLLWTLIRVSLAYSHVHLLYKLRGCGNRHISSAITCLVTIRSSYILFLIFLFVSTPTLTGTLSALNLVNQARQLYAGTTLKYAIRYADNFVKTCSELLILEGLFRHLPG